MNLRNLNIYKGLMKVAGLSSIMATLALCACVDDKLGIADPSNSKDEEEEDAIAFTIQLDKESFTRADNVANFSKLTPKDIDKYDDYIDTQDKFRVFFFTADGDFLFGATDRVVGGIENTTSTGYWYIRIPMTMLVDRDNQEYDINKIKDYLKTHDFKVAVLANWPNAGAKVNPADWDDSEGTNNAIDNPSSTLKGNPLWNWSNSILNSEAKSEDIRNINDLHHVYQDIYWGDASRRNVFERLMSEAKRGDDPGLYMGEPTDWVKMRDIPSGWKAYYKISDKVKEFENKTTANQWIRANWTPEVTPNQKKKIYRHYQHMWFLWNFDASYKYGKWLSEHPQASESGKVAMAEEYYGSNWGWNDASPAEVINTFGLQWYDRNGDYLYKWMKPSLENTRALTTGLIDIGESNNDVFFQYNLRSGYDAFAKNVNGNYGLQLPAIGKGPHTTNQGMLFFQARTSGTLRIKWGSLDGTPSTLAVQNGLRPVVTYLEHSGVTSQTPVDWNNQGVGYLDVTVEGNSEPMHIYCTEGKAVVYSVEFIRGIYLYETDREGVAPSAEQGIPMYGVQDYKAIGEWQRGTTFNLSEGADGKNIYLIRALAKVEVFLKKSFGIPRHVYMRNLNRAGRCEPMDVETPTETYWNEKHSEVLNDDPSNPQLKEYCEWFDIQRHGASYKKDYTSWLDWFYGSWNSAKWTGASDRSSAYVWDFTQGLWVHNGDNIGWKNPLSASGDKSPHYFNPYMYRSGFCRFLQTEDEGDYYHFVLYLPEKNIDDPAVAGNTETDPRVPHIEYRFFPQNMDPETGEVIEGYYDSDDPAGTDEARYSNFEYNLEDNDCFRIYFTNYGQSSNSDTPINQNLLDLRGERERYEEYEKTLGNLNLHWPIMRNHCYKLYVGGEGPQNPEIHVEVSDWGHRKVVVKW